MIDLILLLLLGYLLVRGWWRGFVREAMDLVGLVVATVLAFRLAPAFGAALAAMGNISSDAARFIGGTFVFLASGIGAAFGTRMLEQRFRLPGLNLANKAAGASLAAAWGLFLATMILSLAAILPMPSAVASHLEGSPMTRALTDPDGVPQGVFTSLAGDRIVDALLNLRDIVGARNVIVENDEVVEFPAAEADDLEPAPRDAQAVFELLNRARIDAGLDPLAWSDALAAVGEGHALEMYLDGYFSHQSPLTGSVVDRLAVYNIIYRLAGENLALAASPDQVHDGLMDSPGHRANILRPEFRRVGIGVIEGPLGIMTVQVFTG